MLSLVSIITVMKRFFFIALVSALMAGEAFAQAIPSKISFNNEATDTARLTSMLMEVVKPGASNSPAQSYVLPMAEKFLGTPYKGSTLDGEEELLRVNLDGMDCTTFVETVAALALSAAEGRSSWRDFTYNLERLRYRGGKINGYGSRLHYISDWALDNNTLGLITEVTDRVGQTARMVKSLDWMTTHRSDYPQMKDDEVYEEIKHVEGGYHGHLIKYIKNSNTGGAQLADGDIVALVSRKEGLDVSHMGIIKMVKGKAHLLHASSTAGKVVVEEKPLMDYLSKRRDIAGIRVFRLMPN